MEISVLSTGATKAALLAIKSVFEQASGHRITLIVTETGVGYRFRTDGCGSAPATVPGLTQNVTPFWKEHRRIWPLPSA